MYAGLVFYTKLVFNRNFRHLLVEERRLDPRVRGEGREAREEEGEVMARTTGPSDCSNPRLW